MTPEDLSGRANGAPVDPNANPARPTLLKDASFKIHALATVGVRIEYGDPKHPTVLSSLDDQTPLEIRLNESLGVTAMEDSVEGTVKVTLNSPERERVKNDGRKLVGEESALAQDFVRHQEDLGKLLSLRGIGPGSLLRVVLTAPVSALY